MVSRQQTPKATVVAIITKWFGDKEHILLTQRNVKPYKNKWCLPGGHIEENELAADAVFREVEEETGLKFMPEFYIYVDEIIREKKIHAVPLVFCGTASGTLIKKNEEVKDARWVSVEEAIYEDLAFQHKDILLNYLDNPVKREEKTLFTELNYLRDEIIKRFETRNRMIYFTILLAGIVISFGETAGYLLYPILGTVFAGLWSHSDIRIGDIADYIKTNIEPNVYGLNWENHLSRKYKAFEVKEGKIQERLVLWVFYSTYLMMIILLAYNLYASATVSPDNIENQPSDVWINLIMLIIGFPVTIVCMFISRAFIRKRRKNYTSAVTRINQETDDSLFTLK